MNERIKAIAQQAGYRDIFDNDTKARARLEKYTELIVRECVDSVLDSSVEYCTRPQIASEIKEHFGVEE